MDTSDAIAAIGDIPAGISDIDQADAHDPACVADYAREIHLHQREDEVRTLTLPSARALPVQCPRVMRHSRCSALRRAIPARPRSLFRLRIRRS